MTSDKSAELRPSKSRLIVALIVALPVVAILVGITMNEDDAHRALVSAIEIAARFLGLVIAIAGALAIYDLRSAQTTGDVVRTLATAAVPILVGATLVASSSWGPPVGAGLAMVAMAIAHRGGGSSESKSSN